jgi:hypothetical protein
MVRPDYPMNNETLLTIHASENKQPPTIDEKPILTPQIS